MGKVIPLPVSPVTLAELAREPARAADVPPAAIPALLAQCAALQGALAARLLVAPAAVSDALSDELLTVPAVAERLRVPQSYVYELARTGRLPCVRFGKYVRIEPSALAAWVRGRRQKNALDRSIDATYSPPHDGSGTSTAAPSARADASGPRTSRGHQRQQHRAPRARRNGHQGTAGAADSAPGADALESA